MKLNGGDTHRPLCGANDGARARNRDAFEGRAPRKFHRAEHGVGLQPAASGSFLKSVVVRYGPREYTRILDLRRHGEPLSPFGIVFRSKYSVTVVFSLYGAPFLRT